MLRFNWLVRVGLIIFLGLAVAWILLIGSYYRSHSDGLDAALPSPQRLGAMIALLETASPQQESLLLNAASGDRSEAKLVARDAADPAEAGVAAPAWMLERYATAFGERPARIQYLNAGRFYQTLLVPNGGFLFRVSLSTGQDLLLQTRGSLYVNRFGLPMGFALGLFGTIIALIALYVMQRETRPLAQIAAAVDRVDLNAAPVLLPEFARNAPEIRAVASAFNRLQDRLWTLIRGRMALLGGISHDVRTFATRLQLRVDLIADPDERRRATEDIADMIRLLDDAVLASRAGAGELQEEMVEFCALARSEAESRKLGGATVTCSIDPAAESAILLGDRLALKRLIANLADNAVKYGQAAHLLVHLAGSELMLIVDDEGPGIPDSMRALMLEPFARLETSRNRQSGGAGLGLAIVRNIVEAHHGTIEIAATPKGHGRIVVRLPVIGV